MNSVAYVNERIEAIQSEIFGMHKWAISKGLDDVAIQNLIAPYQALINDIYSDDMPFAKTMDSSDLVIRATGMSVRESATHLNSVDKLFNLTRKQVQRLAKAIAGIADVSKSLPKDVDLLLTGTAPGSFIFGVALPQQDALGTKERPLYESDALYESVKESLNKLSIVAMHVDGDIDDLGLQADVPDPGVRDALMSVAAEMSPTGRSGIDELMLYSQTRDYDKVKALTPVTRRLFKERVNAPLKTNATATFIGTVREIDLDANRFEIRGVQGIGGIRCIFKKLSKKQATQILGVPIKVYGSYVTDASGQPRLMEVEEVTPLPQNIQETLLDN